MSERRASPFPRGSPRLASTSTIWTTLGRTKRVVLICIDPPPDPAGGYQASEVPVAPQRLVSPALPSRTTRLGGRDGQGHVRDLQGVRLARSFGSMCFCI